MKRFFVLTILTSYLCLTPAFADDKEEQAEDRKTALGKELCKTKWDKKDPSDPCGEALVADTAADAQMAAMAGYAAATGICVTECFFTGYAWDSAGCKIASMAVLGFDIAAAIQVASTGQDVAGQMAVMIPTMGGQVMGNVMAWSSGTSGVWSGGETFGEKGKEYGDTTACISAAINGVQTAIRGLNSYVSAETRDSAYRKKVDLMPSEEQPEFQLPLAEQTGGNSGSNGGGATQSNPKAKYGKHEEKNKKVDQKKIAEMAATAYGPMMKKFEDMTGKSVEDLVDRVGNKGQAPLFALAEMGGGAFGENGIKALGEMNKNSAAIADANKGIMKKVDENSKFPYTSGGGGRAIASSSGGAAVPNFSQLLSQLIPKKEAKETAESTTGAVRIKTAAANKDGIHSAEKSLFDIVGARYQHVQGRFLAGTLTTPEVTLVPQNPYLKKN